MIEEVMVLLLDFFTPSEAQRRREQKERAFSLCLRAFVVKVVHCFRASLAREPRVSSARLSNLQSPIL
jgi:hypothetical protein